MTAAYSPPTHSTHSVPVQGAGMWRKIAAQVAFDTHAFAPKSLPPICSDDSYNGSSRALVSLFAVCIVRVYPGSRSPIEEGDCFEVG